MWIGYTYLPFPVNQTIILTGFHEKKYKRKWQILHKNKFWYNFNGTITSKIDVILKGVRKTAALCNDIWPQ